MSFEAALVLVGFIFLLAFGVPIAVSLVASGFLGLLLVGNFPMAMTALAYVPFSSVANGALIVIPLFVLTGQVAFASGISSDAYDMANRWFGRFRGGLAMASIAACAAFAATTGSSVATAATVGKIAIPEMRRFGYRESLATGCVAAGGVLGIMIPPSVAFIIYGVITETSIGKLLIAGIVPGLMTAAAFIIGIFVLTKIDPSIAPVGRSYPWKERFTSLMKGTHILILFFTIIGGIYTGVFTPSEAAAVGCGVAFLLAFVRRAKKHDLLMSLRETASTSAMIFLLLVGAFIFSQFMAISGAASDIAAALSQIPGGRTVTLLLILLLYIPMGMFLDGVSMLLITMPVVFPALMNFGYDPIWLGVIMVKMIEIALITPPVGFNIFILKGVVPDVKIETIFRGALFFVLLEAITVGILIAFPEIALWLPNKVF